MSDELDRLRELNRELIITLRTLIDDLGMYLDRPNINRAESVLERVENDGFADEIGRALAARDEDRWDQALCEELDRLREEGLR